MAITNNTDQFILGCENCGTLYPLSQVECCVCHSHNFALLQKCDHCACAYVDVTIMSAHLASAHNLKLVATPITEPEPACQFCGKPLRFEGASCECLESPILKHELETFECDFCGRQRTRYHCECFDLA